MPATMQAIVYRTKGPAAAVLGIETLAVQPPGAGEVMVRMAYSGVNPSDTKGRAGIAGAIMEYPLIVPHSDGAGVVVAVGKGVSGQLVGQRVWVFLAAWQRAMGTAAEYVTLPQQQIAPLPEQVSLVEGATIGIPLMTAQQLVAMAGDLSGKHVLVTGGAGSVAIYAIQLARAAGARVATTVSNPEKAVVAMSAGAELAANYREAHLASLLSFTAGQGFDLIIEVDAASNARQYGDLLAFGGTVSVYGSSEPEILAQFRPLMVRFASLRFFVVYLLSPSQRQDSVQQITHLLASRSLIHPVPAIFNMDEAACAHEYVEQGRGKALLRVATLE
ncbi:NADPH:quinone reductase [Chitinimonas naiadis]